MSSQPKPRPPLSEEQCQSFAGLILLHRVVTEPKAYHAGLLDSRDDELLNPVFKFLLAEGLADIGEDDYYVATERGRQAYQNLLHQQQSYLTHFDIFARTDLGEGTFADPETDLLEDSRWTDLRVAVADYKGIDPYRMVFLAMLAEGRFFENPDWKFDLALGSSFFKELEEIVASQITVEELGYQAEDGSGVAGDGVIEDVILQGSRLNKERLEQRRQNEQRSLFEEGEEPENGEGEYEQEWAYMPYDPYMSMGAYVGSAMFVEALWLSAYW